MKIKRFLPEIVFKYKFGEKGEFTVKGILKTIGINEDGRKWFTILRCRMVNHKDSGIQLKGFHYVEELFSLDRVVEGKEAIEVFFDGLETNK